MPTFAIHTLGCKVNSYESQSMSEAFQARGYEEVDFQKHADVYIIHTCAVTNTAASKSRQKIRQAMKMNPNAVVCVVGCYVQSSAQELMAIEGIDVLIGSSGKQDIVDLAEEAMKKKCQNPSSAMRPSAGSFSPLLHLQDLSREASFEEQAVMHFDHQVRAYLKVQDGCNQFCSYCIIPYTRGRERSLKPDKAIAMAKELVARGHSEIVLAGIHTGRYGIDHGTSLVQLLQRLLREVDGLQRLRLSSIEANEVTEEMIELFASEPRLARHLHIPLQSGDDKTLKAMNRKYNTVYFYDKLQEIREKLPGISISSDVIVGFPGETREDFEHTAAFIRRCELSFLHVFPYSKRQNTIAANMADQVDEQEKKRRVQVLTDLSKKQKQAYHNSLSGKVVQVLIEESKDGIHTGHSSEYVKVTIHASGCDLKGQLVNAVIDQCDEDGCQGHLA